MELHHLGMIEEKEALDDRLAKLKAFIDSESFNEVSTPEAGRLMLQSWHMQSYSQILGERIDAVWEAE